MDGENFLSPPATTVHPGPVPTGFTPLTLAAVMAAARTARAESRDPAMAAREAAWGLHPALPASLIGDAVEHVLARA
jgi:hypothetical protein